MPMKAKEAIRRLKREGWLEARWAGDGETLPGSYLEKIKGDIHEGSKK